MKPFLESFATYLIENHFERFSRSCVIFPSRRAGVYFMKYLAQRTPNTTFVPKITTLNEFIAGHSDIHSADQLYLLYILYDVFKTKSGINETFDEFYFWGQVILSDFNDIDNELADAKKLYSNLSNLKQIEDSFRDWNEEQIKAIEAFWGAIDVKTKAQGQEKFLLLWEKLFVVYEEFNTRLNFEKIGYDGKIYRHVTEKFEDINASDLEYEKIFLVGFNALSKAERRILKELKKADVIEFFWDVDDYYYKNIEHEAGFFLRSIISEFPAPKNFSFETDIINKNALKIYVSPTQVGQAKILPEILVSDENIEQIAIVLADESLLLPVLYSLPPVVKKLNVTMGFPVKQTSSVQFIDALLELQRSSNRSVKGCSVKVRDVLRILDISLIKQFSQVTDLKNILKENISPYINIDKLTSKDICSKIFTLVESPDDYCTYLSSVISDVLDNYQLNSDSDHRQLIEKQVLYSLYREIVKLDEILKNYNIHISRHDTFMRIFRQTISDVSVAFKGEPLAGLQVMGILESRLLDFENIILLSVNEGVFPKSSTNLSLIPHNLRKGFGLLTREHQDAVFAYHFYHILQRTKNVSLVYCTKQADGGRGEASRFIHQLRYDGKFNISEYYISDKAGVFIEKPIIIERNEQITSILEQYLKGEKHLSPTSLNYYISCPLKFYFKYIAGLKAPDEISEGIDGMMLGNIFHRTVGLLYSGFEGKLINEEDISEISYESSLDEALDKTFQEIIFGGKPKEEISGIYLINYKIIKKYVKRLLDYDKSQTPFLLKGFELPVHYPLTIEIKGKMQSVSIHGFIDRLVEKEGKVIIQDFKTGNVENRAENLEELFYETDKKSFAAMRQVCLYSSAITDTKNVKPEILLVRRNLVSESVNLKIGNSSVDNINDYKTEFDKLLKNIVIQIFNKENPFIQTTNIKLCEWCDYKQICRR